MQRQPTERAGHVLEFIRAQTNKGQFDTWFKNLRCLCEDEGRVVLGAPSTFCKDWIEKHYAALLVTAGREAPGGPVKVEVRVARGRSGADAPEPEAREKGMSPQDDAAGEPAGQVTGFQSDSGFRLNEQYTFDNFVIGPSNRLAHAAALAVSESPGQSYNPLFIHGRSGLGKTHLLQATCHALLKRQPEQQILFLSCETFTNQYIAAIEANDYETFRHRYRHLDVFIVDDIHFLAGKERTQEEFFHTFNSLYNAQKQIILSSDSDPKDIPQLEERLVSRFKWGLVAELEPPHFETRVAILRKKAKLRGVELPDDVVHCIATHLDTNVRELEGAVVKLLGYASLVGRRIDLPLAKESLRDSLAATAREINITAILTAIQKRFNVKLIDLQSRKRTRSVAFPRMVAMFLARTLTDLSLEEIGGHFGGRDHTTVLHAINKIGAEQTRDKKLQDLLDGVTKELKQTQA